MIKTREGCAMIETRLLYYFLAVAREESITKAAETLHITQPTLSKQIRDLEASLGTQLFVRGKKKIELTEGGMFLRARAQEMLNLLNKTESAFQEETALVGGDIYLGCGETPFMKDVADIFGMMKKEYNNIHLHIHSGDVNTLLERLDKGLLDVCILFDPPRYEKYNYLKLKHADCFGLLMPKKCSLARQKEIAIADLQRLPIIFPNQAYEGKERLEWFGEKYEQLNIVATYNLLYNATFLVEQGVGYALCLEGLVDTAGKRDLVFRPFKPQINGELYIVTKKYQVFSSVVNIFLRYVAKECDEC